MANGTVVTEKDYPTTMLWVFKYPIMIFLFNIFFLFLGNAHPILVLAFPFVLITNFLSRANFHFTLEDKLFIVRDGVFAKQQRNLPYGVIQNVFLKQDLMDRIFGLASLHIENASQGGGKQKKSWGDGAFGMNSAAQRERNADDIGLSGNRISIPGLKKENAEELKNYILQKIKENPIEDSQSGL